LHPLPSKVPFLFDRENRDGIEEKEIGSEKKRGMFSLTVMKIKRTKRIVNFKLGGGGGNDKKSTGFLTYYCFMCVSE
jgi:hypothetical protein